MTDENRKTISFVSSFTAHACFSSTSPNITLLVFLNAILYPHYTYVCLYVRMHMMGFTCEGEHGFVFLLILGDLTLIVCPPPHTHTYHVHLTYKCGSHTEHITYLSYCVPFLTHICQDVYSVPARYTSHAKYGPHSCSRSSSGSSTPWFCCGFLSALLSVIFCPAWRKALRGISPWLCLFLTVSSWSPVHKLFLPRGGQVSS